MHDGGDDTRAGGGAESGSGDARGDRDDPGRDGEPAGGARERLGGWGKQGLGMLGAMKDAIEEAIREAKERGDLSQERARELFQKGMRKAQEAAGGAREAFDFVNQKEFERLESRVVELRRRVEALEAKLGVAPDAGSSAAGSEESGGGGDAFPGGADEAGEGS